MAGVALVTTDRWQLVPTIVTTLAEQMRASRGIAVFVALAAVTSAWVLINGREPDRVSGIGERTRGSRA